MAVNDRISGAGAILLTDQHINDRVSGAGAILLTDQHINDRVSGIGAILLFVETSPLFGASGSTARSFVPAVIG